MYTNLHITWGINSDITNSDVSVYIYYDGTYGSTTHDTTIFNGLIRASSQEFYYTIDDRYYNSTNVDYLKCMIVTNDAYLNTDAATATITLNGLYISNDSTGQSLLSTETFVILTDVTSAVDTSTFCIIDREDTYDFTYVLMNFDAYDTTQVTGVINPSYCYSTESRGEYTELPASDAGSFIVYRNTPFYNNLVDGTVHLEIYGAVGTDVSVYVGETRADSSIYIGTYNNNNTIQHQKYKIPSSIQYAISDNSCDDFALFLNTDTTDTYSDLIYNTYVTFRELHPEETLTTDATCVLYDATTPILSHTLVTENRAHVKGGKNFVIDYYTVDNWWNLNVTDKQYNIYKWNIFETVLQNFGRFYNSPYVYNTQLPKLFTTKFECSTTSPYYAILENVADIYTDNSFAYDLTGGTYFIVDSTYGLNLFGQTISPRSFVNDGTYYRVSASISDNTININYWELSSGVYTKVNDSRGHPFNADQTFYLTFYGKRGRA